MKLSVFTAALSLAASAWAVAVPLDAPFEKRQDTCLSQSDAETIVARYAALQALQSSDLGGPRRTARRLLAPDFQETSDSLNEFLGIPRGSVTFSNKRDYINAVLNTAPAELDTIQVLVSGCNYITWYWNAPNQGPAKGFHLLEINSALQISEAWLEFDCIAWNESLGGSCTIATPPSRLMRL